MCLLYGTLIKISSHLARLKAATNRDGLSLLDGSADHSADCNATKVHVIVDIRCHHLEGSCEAHGRRLDLPGENIALIYCVVEHGHLCRCMPNAFSPP